MHVPGINSSEAGPPPLLRAILGMLVGLAVGAIAAAALPRERSGPGTS